MKPRLQNVDIGNKWTESLFVDLNTNLELIVGVIKQTGIFHYVEDEFLTNEILKILEESI